MEEIQLQFSTLLSRDGESHKYEQENRLHFRLKLFKLLWSISTQMIVLFDTFSTKTESF